MGMDFTGLEECFQAFSQGMKIRPGLWRPFAPWEQVAWIHPPWSDEGHLWLDFPEVVIVNGEYFAYAGHGPIGHSTVHHDVLSVSSWRSMDRGLEFERVLPCGLTMGGSLALGETEGIVAMELFARNDGVEIIKGLKMQTCAYLHELREFDVKTADDKYIHTPQCGWIPLTEASKIKETAGRYRFGWPLSKGLLAIADWPVIAAVSSQNRRLIAMTWGKDTYSMVSNPGHPCIHADPFFPDLVPGQSHQIHGWMRFFQGSLDDFTGQIEKTIVN